MSSCPLMTLPSQANAANTKTLAPVVIAIWLVVRDLAGNTDVGAGIQANSSVRAGFEGNAVVDILAGEQGVFRKLAERVTCWS